MREVCDQWFFFQKLMSFFAQKYWDFFGFFVFVNWTNFAKFLIAQNWKERKGKKKPCLWWRENWPWFVYPSNFQQCHTPAWGCFFVFQQMLLMTSHDIPISHNLLNNTSLNIYKYTWALCCYPTSDNFLSYYVPIWSSISHHYLCQCQFNFS